MHSAAKTALNVVAGVAVSVAIVGATGVVGREVASILQELGLPASLLAGTQEQSVKDMLRASTDEAVERGVFGAPTWFVNGELMFWGQDRLNRMAEALAG